MDRANLIRTLTEQLSKRPEICAAWLFGSQARGVAKSTSDVDVAILLRDGEPRSVADFELLAEVQDELEQVLPCEVDVVAANGAAPDLLFRVLRDGVLLYESDHNRRILFEVAARNAYWDLLPILELYRKTVLRGA